MPAHRVHLGRRVVLLAVFSTLTLAAAATLVGEQRARSQPPGAKVQPRALSAPLFTPRRLPDAMSGLLSRARLSRDLAATPLGGDGIDVCVEVRSVANGEVLFALNPDQSSIPASTLKLLTGGAALEVFGADWRFTTRAVADAEVSSGVLDGPLYIVGGGDPLLSTGAYVTFEENQRPDFIPVPPRTDLSQLAQAVRDQGITRIAGPIVGDGSYFDDQKINTAWKQSYFDDRIIAPITGLSVNRNLTNYQTASVPSELGFAANPEANAAEVIKALLAEKGVAVDGPAIGGAAPEAARVVAELRSARLAEVVQHLEQASDNYVAENLLKTLGKEARGEGSFSAGAQVVAETLVDRGVALTGLVMTDGSGLARTNQLSCAVLADLLAHTGASPGLEELVRRLAVAGESGTLKVRYPEDDLKGRLRGKTGSLDSVSNLAGLVPEADGDGDLAFAVLVNGDDGPVAREIHLKVVREAMTFPAIAVSPAG